MKKNLKMVMILTFLLFIYTSICAFSYANNVSSNIAQSVFRLHVLANSDSKEDQDLKYIVRDNLLNYMNSICGNCTSKEEAITLVSENKDKFEEIAIQTIKEHGYDYSVKINIGNFEFPTKNYGDISLPAGYYDALRVEIGEAKGQNWWCVMFPPLCVPAAAPEGEESSQAKEEIEALNEQPHYRLAFATVEWVEELLAAG